MQKIATQVFIYASVFFGIIGLLIVFTTEINSQPNAVLMKLLFVSVITILTSFALSVAGKYLSQK